MNGAAVMDDPHSNPMTIGGLIVSASVALIGGAAWVRRFFSRDAVDRAADGAQTDVIRILREQLAQERERADRSSEALDRALSQISELKAQVFDLTEQVRQLKLQINVPASRL